MAIRIYADFQNADPQGRVRLTCQGTLDDIAKHEIVFQEGMEVILTDYDEFEIKGCITYSEDEKRWVAVIDWDNLGESGDALLNS